MVAWRHRGKRWRWAAGGHSRSGATLHLTHRCDPMSEPRSTGWMQLSPTHKVDPQRSRHVRFRARSRRASWPVTDWYWSHLTACPLGALAASPPPVAGAGLLRHWGLAGPLLLEGGLTGASAQGPMHCATAKGRAGTRLAGSCSPPRDRPISGCSRKARQHPDVCRASYLALRCRSIRTIFLVDHQGAGGAGRKLWVPVPSGRPLPPSPAVARRRVHGETSVPHAARAFDSVTTRTSLPQLPMRRASGRSSLVGWAEVDYPFSLSALPAVIERGLPREKPALSALARAICSSRAKSLRPPRGRPARGSPALEAQVAALCRKRHGKQFRKIRGGDGRACSSPASSEGTGFQVTGAQSPGRQGQPAGAAIREWPEPAGRIIPGVSAGSEA